VSEVLSTAEQCVERTIASVGKTLVVAAPLGLGKPVQLINAFYHRAVSDPSIQLHVVTALSLEVPKPGDPIEANLAGPIMERLFGDYEELAFIAPFKNGTLPANIKVSEVYFKAGSMKNHAVAQQNYVSSNYTHIVRDMWNIGINVMLQMVAARETPKGLSLSLSSNTDLTLELMDRVADNTRPFCFAAQVHSDMPFMEGEAEVAPAAFNLVVINPEYDKALFAVPNTAIPAQDYATAIHASSLIVDGGTLQIGIGSLGDAVAHACIVRHKHNAQYQRLVALLTHQKTSLAKDLQTFAKGLYVSTEMFVNGMMHLIEQGIVKRKVYDNLLLQVGLNEGLITENVDLDLYDYARSSGLLPQKLESDTLTTLKLWGIAPQTLSLQDDHLVIGGNELPNNTDNAETKSAILQATAGTILGDGCILHGGFFLGPRDFYDKLRKLDAAARSEIRMTGVRRTNQLLLDYPLYSAQRRDARFINTGMMVTLNGSVASDALEDGTVISGVGGQYNFVAMAHDLPGARSVLCIRSTRGEGHDLQSNIVPFYGHSTIPKHLRDVIVTEYGVADLRGQSDAQIITRLINIADSRFQDSLLEFAKSHSKIPQDYRIPQEARDNTPQKLEKILTPYQHSDLLPDYPFGTALTENEIALAASLRKIKALSEEPAHFVASTFRALLHKSDADAAKPFLERLQLEHPETTREYVIQQLLLLELEERGMLKVS
jgi:acyl-CoA hydrolase